MINGEVKPSSVTTALLPTQRKVCCSGTSRNIMIKANILRLDIKNENKYFGFLIRSCAEGDYSHQLIPHVDFDLGGSAMLPGQ